MIHRIKYMLATLVYRHPYLWYVAWKLIPHLKFLLPHEKSYYAFRHLAGDAGFFLDVGANNGLSALGFRRLIPGCRIFSIEANKYHEASLAKLKLKLERFDYLIAAAGDRNSEFTLYTAMYKGMMLHTGTSLNLDYLKNGLERAFPPYVMRRVTYTEQSVKVIRLDELNLDPDIIKTDAEGFDYEVLLGLRETITRRRPSILVEYSAQMAGKLEIFCNDLSYSIFIYDDQKDVFRNYDAARELQTHLAGSSPVNLFLIPSEKSNALPMAPV